jgi:hypothetical protein
MRKIFYVPGLISALLIPVLFWFYISPYIDNTNYNIVDIWLPAKIAKDQNNNLNSTFEPLRNWKYKKIKVDASQAKKNSEFYVSEIRALQKRNEKETGLEFILDEKNTYGDFMSLLNDMAIAKHDTYTLDLEKTGNFFAPVNYKDPNAIEEKFECLFCGDVIYTFEKPNLRDKIYDFIQTKYYAFSENISKLPEGALCIMFGFLLFLNISMLSIKERFQLQ